MPTDRRNNLQFETACHGCAVDLDGIGYDCPVNIKAANRGQDLVGRSTNVHGFCFLLIHYA